MALSGENVVFNTRKGFVKERKEERNLGNMFSPHFKEENFHSFLWKLRLFLGMHARARGLLRQDTQDDGGESARLEWHQVESIV